MSTTCYFKRQSNCKACDFHGHTSHVCVCTCQARDPLTAPFNHAIEPRKRQALLVVGEAPGREEEHRGAPFSGPTGIYLWTVYLKGSGILSHADAYTANAVRCRPPGNTKPNAGHLKACRNYLERDIEDLWAAYQGYLTILCVGATATRQVLKLPLTKAFQKQGVLAAFSTLSMPEPMKVPVYSTYHPAYLLPRRNPSAIGVVKDHLSLLLDHLKTPTGDSPTHSIFRAAGVFLGVPKGGLLALDIETYGAVESQPPQRYFHPDKSIQLDGIPPDDLIQTVALTTTVPMGTLYNPKKYQPPSMHSAIYVWNKPEHRRALRKTIASATRNDCIIIGMNLVFDLSYMRAADTSYRAILHSRARYGDVSILSYLHNELRPERDLKSLSAVHNLLPYFSDLKDGHRFENASCPLLHDYNMRDTENTLLLYHTLTNRIREDYGEETKKLSRTTSDWYSNLIWLSLKMTEAGVSMDELKLRLLLDHTRYARQALERKALALPGALSGPIKGPGSAKHITAVMEALNSSIQSRGAPPLERTGVRNEVSSNEANRAAAKQNLKRNWPSHRFLRTLDSHRSHQKLETSYLLPLLKGRGPHLKDQSSKLLNGIAHPSWYLVPSKTHDSEGGDGGTNQGRIICKRPALQTAPPSIKKCLTTRFSPGVLLGFDLSQIELRIAALISGDTTMLDEYHTGKDKHAETAKAIWNDRAVSPSQRQVGKMMNFLMLYRGGSDTLQKNLKAKLNQDVSLSRCAEWINRFRATYHRLNDWQERLIATVCKKGYLELPILGQSRLFLGSPETIRETYTSTICNFPVQCMAANVMISAQRAILSAFSKHNLRATIGLQIYDAIYVECPLHEETIVHTLVGPILENPPFLAALEQHYGRTVPLTYDAEVLVYRNGKEKSNIPGGTGGHP